MVLTCPECNGRFGASFSHAHTVLAVFDPRFATCKKCHGQGAVTCKTCEGLGRVEKMEDGSFRPADIRDSMAGRNQFLHKAGLTRFPLEVKRK